MDKLLSRGVRMPLFSNWQTPLLLAADPIHGGFSIGTCSITQYPFFTLFLYLSWRWPYRDLQRESDLQLECIDVYFNARPLRAARDSEGSRAGHHGLDARDPFGQSISTSSSPRTSPYSARPVGNGWAKGHYTFGARATRIYDYEGNNEQAWREIIYASRVHTQNFWLCLFVRGCRGFPPAFNATTDKRDFYRQLATSPVFLVKPI